MYLEGGKNKIKEVQKWSNCSDETMVLYEVNVGGVFSFAGDSDHMQRGAFRTSTDSLPNSHFI